MAKVLVYVEGQTEEQFIKHVVCPWANTRNLQLVPVIVTTKTVKAGPNFKGGMVSYARERREILRLLGDGSASAVTTMLDYYGLDPSFPGRGSPQGKNSHERVRFVQEQIRANINQSRFIPFLTLHEFEALLFSSPDRMAESMSGEAKLEQQFRGIRNSVNSPEEINDSPKSAPSKRIARLYPGYEKSVFGPIIAGRIGLDPIRKCCSHFDAWLRQLEQLVPTT